MRVAILVASIAFVVGLVIAINCEPSAPIFPYAIAAPGVVIGQCARVMLQKRRLRVHAN